MVKESHTWENPYLRLLYEDVAKKPNVLTHNRLLKYQGWVREAEKARKAKSLDAKGNQYDKAEELITFYTFAPVEMVPDEARNSIVQEILNFTNINEPVRKVKISFEKGLPPPNKYLNWLRKEVKKHPIGYLRNEAETETKKILEGDTQVDAIIETNSLLILIEIKFTSDISPYTQFGLIRNQIARIIDAGLDGAKRHQKKLVVLLSTPTELFQRRSRLYYYKIQEYADVSNIKKDLPWRNINEINETLLRVSWVSLEKIIETVYQKSKKYLDPKERMEAERFFKERMLYAPV